MKIKVINSLIKFKIKPDLNKWQKLARARSKVKSSKQMLNRTPWDNSRVRGTSHTSLHARCNVARKLLRRDASKDRRRTLQHHHRREFPRTMEPSPAAGKANRHDPWTADYSARSRWSARKIPFRLRTTAWSTAFHLWERSRRMKGCRILLQKVVMSETSAQHELPHFTFGITADRHGVWMISCYQNQRLALIHLRSDVLHNIMEVCRLVKRPLRSRFVMAVIDSPTFHHQHETLGILRDHLQRLLCHLNQRRFEASVVKQMILHVTLAEQAEKVIKVSDIERIEGGLSG